MQADLTFVIIVSVAQIISLVACIALFNAYYRLKKRTQGLQMILILCISDFIYHITVLLNTWVSASVIEEIVKPIIHTTMRFSIFWAACIAYLGYTSLDSTKDFPSKFSTKIALVAVLLVSIILSTL